MRAVPTRFRSSSPSAPTRGHGAANERLFGSSVAVGAFAHLRTLSAKLAPHPAAIDAHRQDARDMECISAGAVLDLMPA
jgi:hypothetical protein